MMQVYFSEDAENDLVEIGSYIAERNENRAISFVEELRSAAKNRGTFPHSGRHRSDVDVGLYTFPYGRYILIYSVEPDHVLIKRVIHSARDVNRIIDDS